MCLSECTKRNLICWNNHKPSRVHRSSLGSNRDSTRSAQVWSQATHLDLGLQLPWLHKSSSWIDGNHKVIAKL